MLRIKDVTNETPPVKVVIDLRGEKIVFWLRPWDAKTAQDMRRRYIRGFEWITNPLNNRREKTELVDDDAFFDAMVDYIVAGFEGIGDESGSPWPQDIEHKKRLIGLTVERGAIPLWERILESSKNLAFVEAEAESALVKN